MLRDDLLTLIQYVHSMQCFVCRKNMLLLAICMLDDIMMKVRAAGSIDERDVQSAKLAGTRSEHLQVPHMPGLQIFQSTFEHGASCMSFQSPYV